MKEIEEVLTATKGATPVSFVAETEVDLTGGKKCPFKGTVAKSFVTAMLNVDYETKVNRELEKQGQEPDFEVSETWGEHETPCIIKHTPKGHDSEVTYLQVLNPLVRDVKYFLDGEEVPASELEAWKRKREKSVVKCRRYKLSNIRQVTVNNQTIVNPRID